MSNAANGAQKSLTGVWQGLYSYPGAGEAVSFVATLIESGAFLSGTTHETCAVADMSRKSLNAMLSGVRGGGSVAFTKSYDGSAGWIHKVEYEGALNGEATEIEGTWNINGLLSGRFMMIRDTGKDIAVHREVFENA